MTKFPTVGTAGDHLHWGLVALHHPLLAPAVPLDWHRPHGEHRVLPGARSYGKPGLGCGGTGAIPGLERVQIAVHLCERHVALFTSHVER